MRASKIFFNLYLFLQINWKRIQDEKNIYKLPKITPIIISFFFFLSWMKWLQKNYNYILTRMEYKTILHVDVKSTPLLPE